MIAPMNAPQSPSLNLLLIAGSAEARRAGAHLMAQGHEVTAWFSEPPRAPEALPFDSILRDAGDPAGLERDMARFDAVLDLGHAFDAPLRHAVADVAAALEKPLARFDRPPWSCDDPLLHAAPDVASAAARIPEGARVFAATGWASLPAFQPFPGARLMLRQTHRHDRPAPFDFVDLIYGAPPFDVAGEQKLFQDRAVDLLICRNLGGTASRPKVDAALELGLPVILIDRPALPDYGELFSDLDALTDWVARL